MSVIFYFVLAFTFADINVIEAVKDYSPYVRFYIGAIWAFILVADISIIRNEVREWI